MIIEYHRPTTVEQALVLLARKDPPTYPLGGGSILTQPTTAEFAVVDLRDLGLNQITLRGSLLEIGATVPLQLLVEYCKMSDLPFAGELVRVIEHEANYHLRHQASLGGTVAAAGGRSPLATALLALDAGLVLLPENETISLGDLLPIRSEKLPGRLISNVLLPQKAALAFEYVARTPADQPIVCAAAARWPSGRTRLALGGFGKIPLLAMDGPEAGGIEAAAASAYSSAGDQWASAEYRQEAAGVLAMRCLKALLTSLED